MPSVGGRFTRSVLVLTRVEGLSDGQICQDARWGNPSLPPTSQLVITVLTKPKEAARWERQEGTGRWSWSRGRAGARQEAGGADGADPGGLGRAEELRLQKASKPEVLALWEDVSPRSCWKRGSSRNVVINT